MLMCIFSEKRGEYRSEKRRAGFESRHKCFCAALGNKKTQKHGGLGYAFLR